MMPRPVLIAASLLLAAGTATGCADASDNSPGATPEPEAASGSPTERFDIQAHRGGLGLMVESTIPAFANALELGVSTLELDVQITADGAAVVTHDRQVSPSKCQDTAPARADDPQFPYVGKYIRDLTLAQVQTLDCGSLALTGRTGQVVVPGERMPLLADVLALVRDYGATDVMLNIETKVEAAAPGETAPREQFVEVVADEVRASGMADQVMIQSFDWGALTAMRAEFPELPLVALTNGDFLEVDQPGASPWLGGLDIDDFAGDLVAAAASIGAAAISPVHGFPQDGAVTDEDYEPFVTADLVDRAHGAGLEVIPWTVNDAATMRKLLDDGVDGIITDYPDVLREVLVERGLELPEPQRR
ncbi:glycerophosphodiester phosphodiesterase family protein [Lolliginicoccus suaedae]|uniref:glycerophosphodiester phosphodiesterase family protein n=1 Tax=Lolliginicoccus suaedae TaxID=2605429 RepID=UPI001CA83AB0|nr:glycerophosphodiester phosphodiesterase family protein [Lolliginicoccus suaedae]